MTSVWQLFSKSGKTGEIAEGDPMFIQARYNSTWLEACGKALSDNRQDVSTTTIQNRENDCGTWSFEPYDNAGFEAMLKNQAEVPPSTFRIERVQCVVPSSGAPAASIIGVVGGVIGTAAAAISVFAIGMTASASVVVKGGAAVPVLAAMSPGIAVGLVALTTTEIALITTGVTIGVQKASLAIGQNFADQVYIKVNGQKVWPSDAGYKDMNAGDAQDVGWSQQRSQQLVEIYEHDFILQPDDLMFRYQLPPDIEYFNSPLVAIDEGLASSYLLYITATKNRSNKDVLRAQRKSQIEEVSIG